MSSVPVAQPQASSETELWRRWRSERDVSAREQLITQFQDYARIVAATYYARRISEEIEFGDYLQLARIGLIESVDRYDPAVGAQFKTFAARRMHGSILSGLERLTEKQQQIAVRQRLRQERLQAVKAEAADAAGFTSSPKGKAYKPASPDSLFRYLAEVGIGLAIAHLLEGTGMVDPGNAPAQEPQGHYQHIELKQLQQRIRELVGRLSEQEKTVIRYHYLQEHSFDEIASTLKLTRGRISQIHHKALSTLRNQLGAQRRCDVAL